MSSEAIALEALAARLASLGVRQGEPLAQHTSFQVGGPADLFVVVHRREALMQALSAARELDVPHIVLGGGTNVLAGDRGWRGLVIQNRSSELTVEHAEEPRRSSRSSFAEMLKVRVCGEAGLTLAGLSRRALQLGLGGLAWAEGIPGTLGGAVVNNAGAFGGAMADVVVEAAWQDHAGQTGVWPSSAIGFGYRTSRLKGRSDVTLLAITLELMRQDGNFLRQQMLDYATRRRQNQPRGASAGSVFKNPLHSFAGRLIEEAGLKGRRCGGAYISEKHANYLINEGGATARDIRELIEVIRSTVLQRFSVELELEIELIGEF